MENAGNTVLDDFVFVEKYGKNVAKYVHFTTFRSPDEIRFVEVDGFTLTSLRIL
jgi:hypothetical protein